MDTATILIIAILIVSPTILAEKAFAEYNTTTKEYSCNSSDMQASKSAYSYFVYQVNKYWSGERPEDIAATILKSTYPSMMLINVRRSIPVPEEHQHRSRFSCNNTTRGIAGIILGKRTRSCKIFTDCTRL